MHQISGGCVGGVVCGGEKGSGREWGGGAVGLETIDPPIVSATA